MAWMDANPMPREVSCRLVAEHLGAVKRPDCSAFASHMHNVADELLRLLIESPSTKTTDRALLRDDMLDGIVRATVALGYDKPLLSSRSNVRDHCSCRLQSMEPSEIDEGDDERDRIRRSSFIVALMCGWERIAEQLLATPELQPADWCSPFLGAPLAAAIIAGNTKIMNLILEHGIPITHIYTDQWYGYAKRVLGSMAQDQHADVIRTLVRFAHRPEYRTVPWDCLAVHASLKRQWKVAKILLESELLMVWSKRQVLEDAKANDRAAKRIAWGGSYSGLVDINDASL